MTRIVIGRIISEQLKRMSYKSVTLISTSSFQRRAAQRPARTNAPPALSRGRAFHPGVVAPLLRLLLIEDSSADEALVIRALTDGGYHVAHERVDNSVVADRRAGAPALGRRHRRLHDAGFSGRRDRSMLLRERDADLPFIFVSGHERRRGRGRGDADRRARLHPQEPARAPGPRGRTRAARVRRAARAAPRRAAPRLPRLSRRADRSAEPAAAPGPAGAGAAGRQPRNARRSRCWCWISTASRRSTTRSDTMPAIACCSASPRACAGCCAAPTPSRGSAATSSRSCCRPPTSTARCSRRRRCCTRSSSRCVIDQPRAQRARQPRHRLLSRARR